MIRLKDFGRINILLLCFLAVVCLFSAWMVNIFAQEAKPTQAHKIDINALINDTQKQSIDPDRMGLIWWIPEEYWLATATQDPMSTQDFAQELINVFRPYTIIAAVEASHGIFGTFKFTPQSVVIDRIRIKDQQGNIYRPLNPD